MTSLVSRNLLKITVSGEITTRPWIERYKSLGYLAEGYAAQNPGLIASPTPTSDRQNVCTAGRRLIMPVTIIGDVVYSGSAGLRVARTEIAGVGQSQGAPRHAGPGTCRRCY